MMAMMAAVVLDAARTSTKAQDSDDSTELCEKYRIVMS